MKLNEFTYITVLASVVFLSTGAYGSSASKICPEEESYEEASEVCVNVLDVEGSKKLKHRVKKLKNAFDIKEIGMEVRGRYSFEDRICTLKGKQLTEFIRYLRSLEGKGEAWHHLGRKANIYKTLNHLAKGCDLLRIENVLKKSIYTKKKKIKSILKILKNGPLQPKEDNALFQFLSNPLDNLNRPVTEEEPTPREIRLATEKSM